MAPSAFQHTSRFPDAGDYLRQQLNLPPNAPVNLWSVPEPAGGEKPSIPLPMLIKLAIYEIYTELASRFKWFNEHNQDQAWKNSIRHNLSLHKVFRSIQRPVTEPGKGSYWELDISGGESYKRPRKRLANSKSGAAKEDDASDDSYSEIDPGDAGYPATTKVEAASRIADNACRHTRTVEDVERVIELMSTRAVSAAQRTSLLPVFFANLDPAGIPTSTELDLFRADTIDVVSRAILSVNVVFHTRLPMDVGPSLWSRVWHWSRFIHAHWEHLTRILIFDESVFYTDFLDEPNKLEMVLNDLCGFIVDSNVREPANLTEFVEGAGGTLDDLADVVIKYIHTVIARPAPKAIPNSTVRYIRGLFAFIADADLYPKEGKLWKVVPLGPLCTVLIYEEFVEALMAVIMSLTTASAPDTGLALDEAFMLLRRILTTPPGTIWLEEAIDGGLLRAVVTCATLGCARKINHHLRFILRRVISCGLVWYHIASLLEYSLAAVKGLVTAEVFQQCDIYALWEDFISLADERYVEKLRKKYFSDAALGALRRIIATKNVRQLIGTQGNIAMSAHIFRDMTAELVNPTLGVHERAFLRALIHHDYEKHRHSICVKQVEFMVQNPRCLFITLFDYSNPPFQIEVHSATDSLLAAALAEFGYEWSNIVARAESSGGCLQLHMIQVQQGKYMRRWMIPLRTNNSVIYDRLREVAQRLSAQHTREQMLAEINSVLQHAPGLEEIH
ncbi:hypothetical protein DFH09DRAFT_1366218 [Mycena vulgaris]|nr:hypothetical protein DFH09DRAFT_1366218 [Mycena vulgaris]